MQNRIQHALRQAVEAREKALLTGDNRLKTEWLKVAQMWDAVAAEYRELDAARDGFPLQ
ncbi:MAG TPA: hypothetical protein VGL35_05110 [Rhizomicrobium sp.]|jgi:outer membrane protein TolC